MKRVLSAHPEPHVSNDNPQTACLTLVYGIWLVFAWVRAGGDWRQAQPWDADAVGHRPLKNSGSLTYSNLYLRVTPTIWAQ
jgi:hypothetical protein